MNIKKHFKQSLFFVISIRWFLCQSVQYAMQENIDLGGILCIFEGYL